MTAHDPRPSGLNERYALALARAVEGRPRYRRTEIYLANALRLLSKWRS